MAERIIKGTPLNCIASRGNNLTGVFPEGVYECKLRCKRFKLDENKKHKLPEIPANQAILNPVNQGTGTVCRTETCSNASAIGFS